MVHNIPQQCLKTMILVCTSHGKDSESAVLLHQPVTQYRHKFFIPLMYDLSFIGPCQVLASLSGTCTTCMVGTIRTRQVLYLLDGRYYQVPYLLYGRYYQEKYRTCCRVWAGVQFLHSLIADWLSVLHHLAACLLCHCNHCVCVCVCVCSKHILHTYDSPVMKPSYEATHHMPQANP